VQNLAGIIRGPILDVGCGFASPLRLAGIAAIGLDIDERRVRAHAAPAVVGGAARLPFTDASFAAAFSFGLLHHLADADARSAIDEMLRVVRRDGLIAIFDGVLPQKAWRRPIAAAIRAADRGHHMRTQAELLRLFDGASPWHYERVTYAATGLEGLWCVRGAGG
jgi:SAM-dependent methyltransferase